MKLTKKLFIAIMTMALLVVTFGTTTFAWFTLGTSSKIENIQVNVTSGVGMEISDDGLNWKNNISLADSTAKLIDVTSANGIAFTKVNGDAATAGTDYLQIVFYVRVVKNAEHSISGVELDYVSGKDKEFTATNKWVADVDFAAESKTYAQGTGYEFDALNAVKISFTANADTTEKFIYSYANDNNQGEANADGIARAYASAKTYDVPAVASVELPDSYVTYTKEDGATATDGMYKYDQYTSDKAKVLVSTDFGTYEAKIDDTVTNADNTHYIYAKVTMRIWLEGWDADCINAILSEKTKLSLGLKAVEGN